MDLLPNTPDNRAAYRRANTSLDELTGYLVVQTIKDGVSLPNGDDPHVIVLAHVDSAFRYGDAIEEAHRHRGPGEWAIVYNVYADGFHDGLGYGLDLRELVS